MMCQKAWRVMRSPRRVGNRYSVWRSSRISTRGPSTNSFTQSRLVAERNQPLAVAFADDAQHALIQVDLLS